MSIILLAIESSCDDTSAALLKDGVLLSNIMASQEVHKKYGGVVPELASRAHQQNILPVVEGALKEAGYNITQVDVIAYTRGPGLLGSLIVGSSFAKGLSLALNKPLVDVNHLQGHLLSPFIVEPNQQKRVPQFPYLSLLVSGGHTQIVLVNSPLEYEVLGKTIDDAAGEAFDKCAKLLNLGYPGGPVVDKYAKEGNPLKYKFAKPVVGELDFSFSGLKTSLLYFLRDQTKENQNFISENIYDICASFQYTVVDILVDKLARAAKKTGVKEITLSGGVSANSLLRKKVEERGAKLNWNTYLPDFKFTTDNAAMIGIAGYYRYLAGYSATHDLSPASRAKEFSL